MQKSNTMAQSNSFDNDNDFVFDTPRIELQSKKTDDELKFTLSGIDVSIANSIRRIILSEIPLVVFKVSPNDKNKCNIIENTCGLNNEIVKHRLSCIPIYVKEDAFPLSNYIMELNIQNNTDTTMIVTSEQFQIKDIVADKYLPDNDVHEIFPPNHYTGQFIDFVRLKPKSSDELKGKSIHLTCEFDIGRAKEDGAFNAVSTCSYGNTIDESLQEMKLQQLKQKWKDEGKKQQEIDFEVKNWKLLDGKRIFKKNSFDFIIQSECVYKNAELLLLSCKILIDKFQELDAIIDKDELVIKVADSTMKNSYDIILENQDYTVGKVLEYFLYSLFYEKNVLTFCGFKMLHPHDSYGLLRVAYTDATEINNIKGNLKKCIEQANRLYNQLNKEFIRLVE